LARAVRAHLACERPHADRLLEVADEAGVTHPGVIGTECRGCQRDDRDPGRLWLSREPARRGGSVHVGKAEIHEHDVRSALARQSDRLRRTFGFERLEPTRPQDVTHELPVRVVVVHDENKHVLVSGRILRGVPIRLVLADDQYLVREGIRRLLELQDDLEIVATCENLDSLLRACATEHPDVVLTDIRMPPGSSDEGIRAAIRLRELDPKVGVVVLSQYATPSYVLALLEGGSEGRAYLLKERVNDVEQLVAAIRTVADGGSVMDPKVVEALVAESTRSDESPLAQLTPRERDVLREMAEGKNNAAIAESLVLTERSVEKVIHSIFLKLGLTWEPAVHKRVKAVILYLAESA
jgi:DNA-binding NarL/FixJ family response regulator